MNVRHWSLGSSEHRMTLSLQGMGGSRLTYLFFIFHHLPSSAWTDWKLKKCKKLLNQIQWSLLMNATTKRSFELYEQFLPGSNLKTIILLLPKIWSQPASKVNFYQQQPYELSSLCIVISGFRMSVSFSSCGHWYLCDMYGILRTLEHLDNCPFVLCDFPGNSTSQDMWYQGKGDFPVKVTSREIWFQRKVTSREGKSHVWYFVDIRENHTLFKCHLAQRGT